MTHDEAVARILKLEADLTEARAATHYSLLCVSLAMHAIRHADTAAFVAEMTDLQKGIDRINPFDRGLL